MNFTDSPYERMMKQIPSVKRAADAPLSFPSGHSCHGCPYGRGAPCVGICYRNLLKGREKVRNL